MLKDNLYSIVSLKTEDQENYAIEVSLNRDHTIFKGHFPGQPVLPGVCLIEMVKEILKEIKNKPYRMTSASNIKYLQLVDPNINPALFLEIAIKEEENGLNVNVNSRLKDGADHFKLKGNFS